MSNSDEPRYMLVEDVARELRFTTTAKDWRLATLQWLARHAVPVLKRGRVLLLERHVLEVVLRRHQR